MTLRVCMPVVCMWLQRVREIDGNVLYTYGQCVAGREEDRDDIALYCPTVSWHDMYRSRHAYVQTYCIVRGVS
jgi:hypothetical protein